MCAFIRFAQLKGPLLARSASRRLLHTLFVFAGRVHNGSPRHLNLLLRTSDNIMRHLCRIHPTNNLVLPRHVQLLEDLVDLEL